MKLPRWAQPRRWPGLLRGYYRLLRRPSRTDARDLIENLAITQPASDHVRAVIARHATRVAEVMGDPAAGRAFTTMMLNTWETTITRRPDGGAFVITGDIPAMWLRDSTTQLRPFVILAARSQEITDCLLAVVRQQWAFIGRAPYANAFNPEPNNASWHAGDLCDNPWVWEEKYEIDSLAFPIQLAWQIWKTTGNEDALAPVREHVHMVVELWQREQDHARDSSYRFIRVGTGDTLGSDGRGTPVAVTGMTWSGFRPSDDPCTYGYNIPGQLFAAHALDLVQEMCAEVWQDEALAAEAGTLASEIRDGVAAHALRPDGVLAYEVDGLGGQLFMDDANMPSLLSLPLCSSLSSQHPTYRATRRFVLSQANPHYHLGAHAAGIGSPHTPPGHVWPIAIAVQGLTSPDRAKKKALAELLLRTEAGTGLMHESFHVDDPATFTRPWFSWANAMACELLLDVSGVSLESMTGPWHEPDSPEPPTEGHRLEQAS